MTTQVESSVDINSETISEAIRLKELISFKYPGEEKRIFVEPYVWGLNNDSSAQLLAGYRSRGFEFSDNPENWRIYDVDKMADVRFSGIRIKGRRTGLEEQTRRISKVLRAVES